MENATLCAYDVASDAIAKIRNGMVDLHKGDGLQVSVKIVSIKRDPGDSKEATFHTLAALESQHMDPPA